jgi:hypothetical protein
MSRSSNPKRTKKKLGPRTDEGRARGRQTHFKGVKGQFLLDNSEKFLDSVDRRGFYNDVTQDFIKKFGYELRYEENPPEGTDIATLTPRPLEEFLEEEQVSEAKRRNDYYNGLRTVSNTNPPTPDNTCSPDNNRSLASGFATTTKTTESARPSCSK